MTLNDDETGPPSPKSGNAHLWCSGVGPIGVSVWTDTLENLRRFKIILPYYYIEGSPLQGPLSFPDQWDDLDL